MKTIQFQVTQLAAAVENGVPITWQGQTLNSGRLEISLNPDAHREASRGQLDYASSQAQAEFHVLLSFPKFAGYLRSLGVCDRFLRPVRAVLRSAGPILEDHSFQFTGRCELEDHDLLPKHETSAEVLTGT